MKRSAPMKRTPMRRTQPLKAAGPARAVTKLRKCKAPGCTTEFVPRSMTQKACSGFCAIALVLTDKRRAELKAAAADKKQTRAKLEALKTLKELRAESQVQFNRWTRLRDRLAGHGCICCGEQLDWDSNKPGGAVDAGHFVSRGSCPELAFVEANVNAQRKGCNRPGGTTRAKFKAGMIARYGLEVVEWLEGPHEIPHYKHDDYRRIRDTYRKRANALEKALK